MNQTRITQFQNVLEARKMELQGGLRNRGAIASVSTPDLVDQIQNASERELAMRSLERESIGLVQVKDALERIQLGTFGICVECEEEISLKRLTAMPWSKTCIVCQQAADLNPLLPNVAPENWLVAA